MTRDRQSNEQRLEKQRIRQRDYRRRIRDGRQVTHEDLARALLDFVITFHQAHRNQNKLDYLLGKVSARLLEIGLPVASTEQVWLDLETRYQGGWSLLRQRAATAEIEALKSELGSE